MKKEQLSRLLCQKTNQEEPTYEDLQKALEKYHTYWCDLGTRNAKKRKEMEEKIVFWHGKYLMVKQENNQLRKKLKTETP